MITLQNDPIHDDNQPENPTLPGEYSTPNYHLPLWKNNTVTSWLTQMNYAMTAIDVIMHNFSLRTSIDGEVPKELISAVERLEAEMDDLRDTAMRVTQLEQQVTSLQTQMANALQDINTLRINYINIDTRMSTAESAIQNLQAEIDKIQTNVNTNSEDIEEVRSTTNINSEDIDNLRTAVQTIETTVNATTADVSDLESRVSALESAS